VRWESERRSNADDEYAVAHNKLIPIDADTVIMMPDAAYGIGERRGGGRRHAWRRLIG
jgi:hypothetical protein